MKLYIFTKIRWFSSYLLIIFHVFSIKQGQMPFKRLCYIQVVIHLILILEFGASKLHFTDFKGSTMWSFSMALKEAPWGIFQWLQWKLLWKGYNPLIHRVPCYFSMTSMGESASCTLFFYYNSNDMIRNVLLYIQLFLMIYFLWCIYVLESCRNMLTRWVVIAIF